MYRLFILGGFVLAFLLMTSPLASATTHTYTDVPKTAITRMLSIY